MSNNEEKSNGLVQAENSKQTIRNYVRTVKELQMKKLILEKSNAKLAVDLENNRQQSEILKQEKEKEIDRLKTNQKVHEDRANQEFVWHPIGLELACLLILFSLIAAASFGLLYFICTASGAFNPVNINILVIISIVISIIVLLILQYNLVTCFNFESKKKQIRNHYDSILFHKSKLEEINKQFLEICKVKEAIEKEHNDVERVYNQQISINESAIEQITNNINDLLNLAVIPPAYRDIDCVITLDHIFENDLADHMREAVLLYREWLAQERIIAGLENIYKMLGQLSSQMQYMQLTLESIERGVNSICSDMGELVTLQKQNNKTQEQILRESESTRVATEAVRRSNEKYEWYVEQHRQGLL